MPTWCMLLCRDAVSLALKGLSLRILDAGFTPPGELLRLLKGCLLLEFSLHQFVFALSQMSAASNAWNVFADWNNWRIGG